jgi:bifunctional non-homologous end joining protein LigD
VLRRFDALAYYVRDELPERDLVLDGEVIALNPEGRQDFRLLLAGQGNLHYAAFDVLWRKGKDLRRQPLWRRKRILERLIPATSTMLSRVFTVEGRGRDLFPAAERLDLEGIVAKRKADPYAPDRLVQGQEPSVYPTGGKGRPVSPACPAAMSGWGRRRALNAFRARMDPS